MLSFSYLPVYLWTIQLLEYQTDMRRCRFDTLGKLTTAHSAGAPTVHGQWVAPAWWVSQPTAHARWAGVDFPTGINLAHCSART